MLSDLDHPAVERDLRDEILGRGFAARLGCGRRTRGGSIARTPRVEGCDVDGSIDDRLADSDDGPIERDGLDDPAATQQRLKVDLGLDPGGGKDLARLARDARGSQRGVLEHDHAPGPEGHP